MAAFVMLAAYAQDPAAADRMDRERDRWQKPAEVIAALRIAPGSRVADIGAGEGYFTRYLADAVGPAGTVFAVDSNEAKCGVLRRRFAHDSRVAVVHSEASKWWTESPLDAILIVDAYHEFDNGPEALRALRGLLREGGRLVIVDFMRPELGALDAKSRRQQHAIAPDTVERNLGGAGFRVIEKTAPFVPRDPENRRIATRDVFLMVAER